MDQMGLRMNFEAVAAKADKIQKENPKKGKIRLTQSTLILFQDIDVTKSAYTFDLLDTQNNKLDPREIRLNQNDEFVAYELGFYLVGKIGGDKTGADPQLGSTEYFTYFPYEIIPTAKGLKTDCFWDGKFRLGVNNIIFVENWDLRKHRYIPQTQYKGWSVGLPSITQAQKDMKIDGMAVFQPMITLSGAKKTELTITLPKAIEPVLGSLDIALDTTADVTVTKIALIFRGVLAQNGAIFQ